MDQHTVAYMAECPKSTRSYTAYNRAAALAKQTPVPPVPLQIRNAPTRLMKKLGYGRAYAYNPDFAHPVTNEYLPRQYQKHSSLVPTPTTESLLRTAAVEAEDKYWDERKLKEWEEERNGGAPWPGRAVRDARLLRGETVHQDAEEAEEGASFARGTEHQPRGVREREE